MISINPRLRKGNNPQILPSAISFAARCAKPLLLGTGMNLMLIYMCKGFFPSSSRKFIDKMLCARTIGSVFFINFKPLAHFRFIYNIRYYLL